MWQKESHQHMQRTGEGRVAHLRVSMDADMHCLIATLDFHCSKYFCSFCEEKKKQSNNLRIIRMLMYCAFGIKTGNLRFHFTR